VLARQARFLERERAELVVSDNVDTCRCPAATKSIPPSRGTARFCAHCADVADIELVSGWGLRSRNGWYVDLFNLCRGFL